MRVLLIASVLAACATPPPPPAVTDAGSDAPLAELDAADVSPDAGADDWVARDLLCRRFYASQASACPGGLTVLCPWLESASPDAETRLELLESVESCAEWRAHVDDL